MLKAPTLKSSGLHFSVFQDRSGRGAFFKKVLKYETRSYKPDFTRTRRSAMRIATGGSPPPPNDSYPILQWDSIHHLSVSSARIY